MDSRSLPQNKALFGSYQGLKFHLHKTGDETWQTWCHLTQNLMIIPKPLRLAKEAISVGHKMAEKLMARHRYAPPWSCTVRRLAARPPATTN